MGFKLRVKGVRFRVFVRTHETTFKLALKVSALPFALAGDFFGSLESLLVSLRRHQLAHISSVSRFSPCRETNWISGMEGAKVASQNPISIEGTPPPTAQSPSTTKAEIRFD